MVSPGQGPTTGSKFETQNFQFPDVRIVIPITYIPNVRFSMPSGARCGVAFAAYALILLWDISAYSQVAEADDWMQRGYSYLSEGKASDALCAFTAASDDWHTAEARCAIAYCEYRLAHYTHARRQLALLASSSGEKCHLVEKLHRAIVAFEGVAKAPAQILKELDDISQQMLTVRFQIDPRELDYQPSLEVDRAPPVPDAPNSAQNKNVLLADSSHHCPNDPPRSAGPPHQTRAELQFTLLLDPDKPHTLSLLDATNQFTPLDYVIEPGQAYPDEIWLSHSTQKASLKFRVTYEGVSAKPAGQSATPRPESDVQIEVFAERRRVYKGDGQSIVLEPGHYSVHATPPGYRFKYESWNLDSLRLRPGERLVEAIYFRKRPVYRIPWFWLGLMGGATAVGIAVGVPLTLLRDPRFNCGNLGMCIRLP